MATSKLRVVQKLDLDKLTPENLEYFCISDDIDREVMKRRGKEYNEALAFNSLYFIVTKDKRVAVVPNHLFDPWLEHYEVDSNGFLDQSEAAKEAIDWFIRDVHGVVTIKQSIDE